MVAWIAAVQSDGIGFVDIIADIPHDPPAMVVYALVIISGWAIWRGSRSSRRGGGKPSSGGES